MTELVVLRNRMSDADYERERLALRETYGDNSIEAGARRDQALARLFWRANWTQEELAAKEGIKQNTVSQRLVFGRFLEFIATAINPNSLPNNLTERRFRSYWLKTDKAGGNERIRFQEAWELMKPDIGLQRSHRALTHVGKQIVKKFGDAKWHFADTIIAGIDATPDEVRAVLANMAEKGTYKCELEKKSVGTTVKYRISRKDQKTVSSVLLAEELTPIIKELEAEGRKSTARFSQRVVAVLAAQLRRLLEGWCE